MDIKTLYIVQWRRKWKLKIQIHFDRAYTETLKKKKIKRLGHEYAKRRHLGEKKVSLRMPRFFFFFNYLTKKRRHQWDGAEEQLTQGLWVCVGLVE